MQTLIQPGAQHGPQTQALLEARLAGSARGAVQKHPIQGSAIELVPYSVGLHDVWDNVVAVSKNGNFLHYRNYIEYHGDRFLDCSALLLKKGKPVAVFPANRIDDKIVSHSGLTYAGLVFTEDVYAVDILEMFNQLARYYRAKRATRILYKAIPHIYHRSPAEEDLYALFRSGARLYRRDIASVITPAARQRLRRSKGIARARRHNLAVREGDFVQDFHVLLCATLRKFGVLPVHSVDELCLLRSRFPGRIRLFGAFDGGRLLSGAIIYDFGNTAHFQYSATGIEGKQIGALALVYVHILDEVFKDRNYVSFGTSTEDEGRYLNEGLVRHKERFGGRGITHDFYNWEL
jgi:hypothetical protein